MHDYSLNTDRHLLGITPNKQIKSMYLQISNDMTVHKIHSFQHLIVKLIEFYSFGIYYQSCIQITIVVYVFRLIYIQNLYQISVTNNFSNSFSLNCFRGNLKVGNIS